jgi:hypothetical protein
MLIALRVAVMTAAAIVMSACTSLGPRMAASADGPHVATDKPACVTQTASRIPRDADDCDGFGRSYSSADISRTGASTAGGALRLLDPSLTIVH